MKKLILLLVIVLAISCSKPENSSESKPSIDATPIVLHPPTWLQGTYLLFRNGATQTINPLYKTVITDNSITTTYKQSITNTNGSISFTYVEYFGVNYFIPYYNFREEYGTEVGRRYYKIYSSLKEDGTKVLNLYIEEKLPALNYWWKPVDVGFHETPYMIKQQH